MKDLGELKFFLGIEFARSKEGIIMNQRKYVMKLISESGLGGAKPARTPLEMNQKLTSVEYDSWDKTNDEDEVLKDPSSFQRVVRYIKANPELGLLMPVDNTNKLTTYCDSDWGDFLQTRRSITGYLVRFGNAVVS
uniref:Uncharacterized mitochondrial protein AtMg00810-like n=1 Tax=Nicotiana tabacum TaxID=4097 RepID=A0A1S4A754_TOBAC|nr:PREDICTED: uncharacterized mitochondrial protein AtMg00810-like [Nicotiana tabacum]